MKARYQRRDRAAVSEIMGALLTIAITLIAGAAVFGFVNGQAAASEDRYAQAVAGTVNYLNERFVVANMAFDLPSCLLLDCVSFYVYNNGQIDLQLAQVLLYDSTRSQLSYTCPTVADPGVCSSNLSTGSCTGAATISPQIGPTMTPIPMQANPVEFTITLPSTCIVQIGTNYYLNIQGTNGNVVIYYSVR